MTKACFIAAAALAALAAATAIPQPLQTWKRDDEFYPGWAGIEYMFIFGDSYTTTGFNLSLAQPSSSNPLGNPAYPGSTSANGPNWVDFLTTTYNQSFIETVNLAYGGATVDSDLVAQFEPGVLDMRQQVDDEYIPTYSASPSFLPWSSNNTLFGIFIGINDVGNSYSAQNSSINGLVMDVYSSLADQLYQTGARNFLFLNVPPVDRSPLTAAAGTSAQALEKAAIADWNSRVAALAKNLSSTYADSTTFVFDTNALFAQVLDDPCSYAQTCAYENTTAYCAAYEDGTATPYSFDASCGIPVDEYFWLNSLHPTFRVHNVTADQISQLLA